MLRFALCNSFGPTHREEQPQQPAIPDGGGLSEPRHLVPELAQHQAALLLREGVLAESGLAGQVLSLSPSLAAQPLQQPKPAVDLQHSRVGVFVLAHLAPESVPELAY